MLTEILMFPGVLFHELAHYLACLLTGVKVVRFNVSLRSSSGFVVHTVPNSITKSIIIATAPDILAVVFAFISIRYNFSSFLYGMISYLLTFIVLYNSFPSKEDTAFYRHHHIVKKIITFPLFILFRIIHFFGRSDLLRIAYSIIWIVVISSL